MPYYLPLAGRRITGFIPLTRILVLCEMQSDSSRILCLFVCFFLSLNNLFVSFYNYFLSFFLSLNNFSFLFSIFLSFFLSFFLFIITFLLLQFFLNEYCWQSWSLSSSSLRCPDRGPVDWSCRIHRLLLCRRVTPPPLKKGPGYNSKQSNSEAPVMLELWGMQSTSLFPSSCPRGVRGALVV